MTTNFRDLVDSVLEARLPDIGKKPLSGVQLKSTGKYEIVVGNEKAGTLGTVLRTSDAGYAEEVFERYVKGKESAGLSPRDTVIILYDPDGDEIARHKIDVSEAKFPTIIRPAAPSRPTYGEVEAFIKNMRDDLGDGTLIVQYQDGSYDQGNVDGILRDGRVVIDGADGNQWTVDIRDVLSFNPVDYKGQLSHYEIHIQDNTKYKRYKRYKR